MALIVHRKSPALTRLITLYARARMERSGRAMAPPAPRRFFFTSSLAVELIDLHASRSTRSTAAAELWGLLRQHPLRRSTETARVNPLAHPLRAREAERAGRCDGPPTPRRFFFTSSLAVELIDLELIDLHASRSTR